MALCFTFVLVACGPTLGAALAASRRAVLSAGFGAGAAVLTSGPASPAAAAPSALADRFSMTVLQEPGIKQPALFGGPAALYDDVFYPTWMAGEWLATSTLTGFDAPLGAKFLAGPSGLRKDVAEATIRQQKSRIGTSVGPYPLRWLAVRPPGSAAGAAKTFVVEDRAFNTKSRLDAFAGRSVVRRVEYVEVGGANEKAYGDAPLPTTLTTYKFAALQKVFSNNRGQELEVSPGAGRALAAAAAVAALTDGRATPDGATWTGFEFTRTLFARTDQPDAPPVVADSEVLTQLRLLDPRGAPTGSTSVATSRAGAEVVVGRVRLADFLTPNDALFFEARQRAVSISDYDLQLTRLPLPSAPQA